MYLILGLMFGLLIYMEVFSKVTKKQMMIEMLIVEIPIVISVLNEFIRDLLVNYGFQIRRIIDKPFRSARIIAITLHIIIIYCKEENYYFEGEISMKLRKTCCVLVLSVGMLFPTIVYGNDNSLTKDDSNIEASKIISVEKKENDKFSNELNSMQKVTSNDLKKLSQFADIQITEYEDNRVEYTFVPKEAEKTETYDNGTKLNEYEMVTLTAVPDNQTAEIDLSSAKKSSYSFKIGDNVQETITKNHSGCEIKRSI